MRQITSAILVAARAHDGQKDKVGVDYIWHPMRVASYCKTERAKIAAVLHDVVEDSETSLEDLKKAGIEEDVAAAVDLLTKKKGQSLEEYYSGLCVNKMAVEVKFADMRHNADITRWKQADQEKAALNAAKYKERAKKLAELVGCKFKEYMTQETYKALFD